MIKPVGRARHSVRAGVRLAGNGAHGVTCPAFTGSWSLKLGASLVLGCWCLVLLSTSALAVTNPDVNCAVTMVYANVTDPIKLAFAPDGTLFVGRDNSGSGGTAGVRLTWTTNATGYLLETNSALALPAGWGVLTSNYSVLNTNYAVTNALGGATHFYRLHKP